VIVITAGDPAGIGPEVTEKALKNRALLRKADFLVIGCEGHPVKIGTPTKTSGRIAAENIRKAVNLLSYIKGRKALVTAPINKYSLMKAGLPFKGHTEFLAHLTNTKDIAMMFAADHFKLALVTRHIPLSEVCKSLSVAKITKTIRFFSSALKGIFGIKNPKIGVAGLNPHAGDSGTIGFEEKKIIIPAIKTLRREIRYLQGPYPADVLFHQLYTKKLDGAVCMYHDQGLAPFKMLYFEKGVNITLGLPFVRTSPDHGTAFDIAGRGIANPTSMENAIKLALDSI